MAPRDVDLIHASAFISSMAATISDQAKIFPAWAQIDGRGQVLGVDHIVGKYFPSWYLLYLYHTHVVDE